MFTLETSDQVSDQFELAFLAHVPSYGACTYDVVGGSKSARSHTSGKTITCTFSEVIFIKRTISNNTALRTQPRNEPFTIRTITGKDVLALPNDAATRLMTLETSSLAIKLSPTTGTLVEVTKKAAQPTNNFGSPADNATGLARTKTQILSISFAAYTARFNAERSGAYLFLPNPKPRKFLPGYESIRLVKGSLYSEALVVKHQKYLHTYMRLYNSPGLDGHSVEIENHVDMSNAAALNNHELVMIVETDVNNVELLNISRPVMYTDLNGYQMTKRITMLNKLPVQANFFPVASSTFLQDQTRRVTVLSAQPSGAASLAVGQLQIMLDRRLAQDDNRGLGQNLQDNKAETSSRFRLTFESVRQTRNASQQHDNHPHLSLLSQHISLSLLHPLLTYVFRSASEQSQATEKTRLLDLYLSDFHVSSSLIFSALSARLPCDMHLLNVRTEVAAEKSGKTFVPASRALVLLQRFGTDCSMLPEDGLRCPAARTNGFVNLAKVFADFSHRNWTLIELKNLSPLHSGRMVNADSAVHVKPMDVNCFRVPLGVV